MRVHNPVPLPLHVSTWGPRATDSQAHRPGAAAPRVLSRGRLPTPHASLLPRLFTEQRDSASAPSRDTRQTAGISPGTWESPAPLVGLSIAPLLYPSRTARDTELALLNVFALQGPWGTLQTEGSSSPAPVRSCGPCGSCRPELPEAHAGASDEGPPCQQLSLAARGQGSARSEGWISRKFHWHSTTCVARLFRDPCL